MTFKTIPEVAGALGIPEGRLRRAVKEGKVASIQMSGRVLVDAETVADAMLDEGATLDDVSKETGISKKLIMAAIHEGWLPYRKNGKMYRFDMDEVLDAIRRRMQKR